MLSRSFRNSYQDCCSTPHCARFLRGPEGSAATPIYWSFPNARSLRPYQCRSPSSSACPVTCTRKDSGSPCSYGTRSHIASLEAERGPLDCKSTQIRLCSKLPEEKEILCKYKIQPEKTWTKCDIEWRCVGSRDLATLLPFLVLVAINTLLIYYYRVIVKAGSK